LTLIGFLLLSGLPSLSKNERRPDFGNRYTIVLRGSTK
jgi:hypothetical protein